MKSIKNAVAYIRVSTDLQIEGFSLEGQLKEIQDYCKKNNINLIRYYKDAGKSGTSTENRTEFNNMLNDISKTTDINSLIVWKLSRLSRNMADLTTTVNFLEKNNVNLICITQGIDTSNPMGKSFVYMSGIFAEMERDNIVETAKMGLRQRAIDGKWNGGRILGYKSNENKELDIVENEAKIVKKIFDLFTTKNYGYKKIACVLNEKGIKTLKGINWSINAIKKILDNPIYVGYIRWGQYEDWSKKRRKGKTDNYILSKGIHIPIISKETWEKARTIREARGKVNDKVYEGNFLLSGLIKCPVCGSSMISHRTPKRGKPGEYYRYYQCSTFFNKGVTACKSNLLNADKTEKDVLDKIYSIVNSDEVIDSILSKHTKQSKTDTKPLHNELKKLNTELNKISDKKNENMELEYDNKIDMNTLNQRLSFLNKKEFKIIEKINSIEKELAGIDNGLQINVDSVKAVLKNFTTIFKKSTIETKKLLLKSLIECITVTQSDNIKNRIIDKIKLYFEPEEIQALNSHNLFATTCGTVHCYLF